MKGGCFMQFIVRPKMIGEYAFCNGSCGCNSKCTCNGGATYVRKK